GAAADGSRSGARCDPGAVEVDGIAATRVQARAGDLQLHHPVGVGDRAAAGVHDGHQHPVPQFGMVLVDVQGQNVGRHCPGDAAVGVRDQDRIVDLGALVGPSQAVKAGAVDMDTGAVHEHGVAAAGDVDDVFRLEIDVAADV